MKIYIVKKSYLNPFYKPESLEYFCTEKGAQTYIDMYKGTSKDQLFIESILTWDDPEVEEVNYISGSK